MRKRLILAALLPAALLLAALPARAAFDDHGAGARAPGLGDAFAAVADDVHAIHYNPAGLGLLERPELGMSYTRLHWGLSDGSNLGNSFVGYAHPLAEGRHGTVATSWGSFSLNNGLYREDALSLAYGRLWLPAGGAGEGLYAGLAARYLRAGLGSFAEADNATQSGSLAKTGTADPLLGRGGSSAFDADLGLLYRFGTHYAAGLTARHLLRPDVSIGRSGDRLPLELKAGIGYRSLLSHLTAEYATRRSPAGTQDQVFTAAAERWFARLYLGDVGMRGALSLGSRDMKQASAGFSYRTRRFQVDYAFALPIGGVGTSAGSHRAGISFRFGRRSDEEESVELLLEAMRRLKPAAAPARLEAEGRGLSAAQRATVDEYLAQSRSLQARARYHDALQSFGQALMVAPADKKLVAAYGRLNFVGQQIKILPEYKTDPLQARLHEGLTAYLAENDLEAVQKVGEALDLKPDFKELDAFLTQLEQVTGAKRLRREGPKPDYEVAALLTRAATAIQESDYPEAVELSLKVLRLQPDNAAAWENLGTAYFALGDYDSSIKAWRKALEHEKSPAIRAAIKGYLKSVARAQERGARQAVQARPLPERPSLTPGEVRSLYNQGLDHFTRREFEQAKKAFETILQAEPGNAEALKALQRVKEMIP